MGAGMMFLFLVVICVLGLFLFNQQRTAGKILAYFLEEDKSVVPELRKIGGDFFKSRDGAYDIFPAYVRLIRYPAGWPRLLQQIVPTSLYERGNAVPIDWITIEGSAVSAKEIEAVLDPVWLANLVRGVREGGGIGKQERMMLFLAVGLGAICMVLLFVVIGRL